MKVKDGLKGIASIHRIHSSRSVVIFYIDVNKILKREEPQLSISDLCGKKKYELTWLDPREGVKRHKTTSIDFEDEFSGDWLVVTETSRYTTFVVFLRKQLVAKSIPNPVYVGK